MKGILFKPWKIKAIAEDDREWQTRRVIKPQFKHILDTFTITLNQCSSLYIQTELLERNKNLLNGCIKSRYQVGEVVYIKEGHYRYGHWQKNGFTKTGRQKWAFKADTNTVRYLEDTPLKVQRGRKYHGWYKRSPLFMPARAARYFIKITDIRAERLQEITEEDAYAEGCPTDIKEIMDSLPISIIHRGVFNKPTPLFWYENLWDSINPKYPWESKPWVFVYSFKKAEIGVNAAKESMANV